jgi:superfamily II DNA or RNA helicase
MEDKVEPHSPPTGMAAPAQAEPFAAWAVLHAQVDMGGDEPVVRFWLEGPPYQVVPLEKGERRSLPLGVAPHPFSLSFPSVWQALVGTFPLLPAWMDGCLPSREAGAREGLVVSYLPGQGPVPLPWPGAPWPRAPEPGGPAHVRPWAVRALEVSARALAVPLSRPSPTQGLLLGPEVRWLGQVATLAQALWLRGAVCPLVTEHRGLFWREIWCQWQPLLDEPDLRPLLEKVAASFPLSLESHLRPHLWGSPHTDGWKVLVRLVGTWVDVLGRYPPDPRGRPRAALAPRAHLRRVTRQPQVWAEMARALAARSPTLLAKGHPAVDKVAQRLAEWALPAREGQGRVVVRLAFELEPPAHPQGETQKAPVGWRLHLTLRSLGNAGEGVDLEQALTGSQGAFGLSKAQLAALAREQLAKATAWLPPLASWSSERDGPGLPLSPQEALRFLQEWGPQLSRQGFPVVLPEWWQRRLRRVLRLELAVREEPGPAHLGLEALTSFQLRVRAGEEELDEEALRRILRQGGGIVPVGGGYVEVTPRQLRLLAQLLEALDGAGQEGGELRLPQRLILRLLAESQEAWEEAGSDASQVTLAAQGFLAYLAEAAQTGRLPAQALAPADLGGHPLAGKLRPYQEEGVRFLHTLAQRGLGACLADDMGLGKTVQAIGLMVLRRRQGWMGPWAHDQEEGPRPSLLVCPTSVLTNWQRELARFAPEIRVHVQHGSQRDKDPQRLREVVRQAEVVLTTYALVWRDLEALQGVKWDGVFLDEAQAVKNPTTHASRAVRRLAARYRVALTGTPLENRLTELWSLFQFLNPGYLGSLESFRRRFVIPVEQHGETEPVRLLRRLCAPFLLRRVKTDPKVIQDLPPKLEIREPCLVTREQALLYQRVVENMVQQLHEARGMRRRAVVSVALLYLKQILNHPAQFLKEAGPIQPHRSGKLLRLEEILEEALAEGDRLLLFTQFVAFGRLLQPYLSQLVGQEIPFLHGGLARGERDRVVARFQSPQGPPLLLLSLRAAGVGLNLTRATRVVHLDRWWNPAVETQATDRAHRIGQEQRVMVHLMVTQGTVEERVDDMLREKRELAEAVVGKGEAWLTELSDEALVELVRLGREAILDP